MFEPEPGIRLPAVLICKQDARASLTLIPGRDKQAARRALDAGRAILAFDVAGILERLDVSKLRELWPGGEVSVQP